MFVCFVDITSSFAIFKFHSSANQLRRLNIAPGGEGRGAWRTGSEVRGDKVITACTVVQAVVKANYENKTGISFS